MLKAFDAIETNNIEHLKELFNIEGEGVSDKYINKCKNAIVYWNPNTSNLTASVEGVSLEYRKKYNFLSFEEMKTRLLKMKK